MAQNYKRLVNSDKARNRFLRLRYKEGCAITDMPTISASELAAKLGISKSVIAKLED